MSKTNNYDGIAKYYDFLSRSVFFHAQVKAQTDMLSFIPPGSRVLIAGGGTGWILNELSKVHPQGLKITYVEISSEMIRLAKAKYRGNNEVHFVHSPVEDFTATEPYDAILTPFLFDNFVQQKAEQVFLQLRGFLKDGGHWLFTDFFIGEATGKWWQRSLLRIMYLFFHIVSRIEAQSLVDMSVYFAHGGFEQLSEKRYYAGFIKSVVYTKR